MTTDTRDAAGATLYTPPAFAADSTIGWQIVHEQPLGLLLLPGGSITTSAADRQ